jgi:hypothetical protein
LSVRATGHPVWNRARAITVGHALEARAPPATCSTPCPVLRCSRALRYHPYPRATQLHRGESLFASPSLAPASLAVHRCNAEYTTPVSSSIRRFSPRFTTAAAPSYPLTLLLCVGTFPKPATAVKSCLKQAKAVHHPPLRCLAVDSAPPIPSRSAATSPSWALGLCCSPTRKPSSSTACAAQHHRLTPTRACRRGG